MLIEAFRNGDELFCKGSSQRAFFADLERAFGLLALAATAAAAETAAGSSTSNSSEEPGGQAAAMGGVLVPGDHLTCRWTSAVCSPPAQEWKVTWFEDETKAQFYERCKEEWEDAQDECPPV